MEHPAGGSIAHQVMPAANPVADQRPGSQAQGLVHDQTPHFSLNRGEDQQVDRMVKLRQLALVEKALEAAAPGKHRLHRPTARLQQGSITSSLEPQTLPCGRRQQCQGPWDGEGVLHRRELAHKTEPQGCCLWWWSRHGRWILGDHRGVNGIVHGLELPGGNTEAAVMAIRLAPNRHAPQGQQGRQRRDERWAVGKDQ